MSKFESGVKMIPYSQENVYSKLSDLNNLEGVKDKIPADKIQDLSFDANSISFSVSPVGNISLQIVEREPSKCVKLATTTSPVPFKLWIQIAAVAENECKIKLTMDVDINPMMKMMVQKPLQDGLERMADAIASIPY